MKKGLSFVLAALLCISMVACGNNNSKKAFDNSKQAFEHVTNAYLATNDFSQDIYEAWFQGVNNRTDFDDESELDDFAKEMHIDLEHIKAGVASLLKKDSYAYGDWEILPYLYNNSYFSAWISVISEAYKCSGKADIIAEELNTAKTHLKKPLCVFTMLLLTSC